MSPRLILFVFLGTIPASLFSQGLRDTLKIQEISVSPERTSAHNSLTVTRLDTIVMADKSTSSLSEALSENTTIYIKSYGRGSMASASFRGTDPSHTRVLWNGIELNSPMLGMTDFSTVPVFFSDNIELLHGSSSLSETSGALGGVINLSTVLPNDNKLHTGYQQGIGSFGSYDEHLTISAGIGKIQSRTRLFYSHSDNDFSFINNDIVDSVDLNTGRKYHARKKNENAWFTARGILQEFRYSPTERDYVSLSFWGQNSSRSIPVLSTSENGPGNNINRQEDNSLRAQVTYKHYGDKLSFKFFSGLNYMELGYDLKNRLWDDTYLTAIDSRGKTASLYNKAETEWRFSDDLVLTVTAGADLHKVDSYEKVKQFGYKKDRVQSHISASVFKAWNRSWRSSLKIGSGFIDFEKSEPVFHAGTEFHPSGGDRLYFRMAVASNAKYPGLNDLYYQPGGNTGLKPERSLDQELGMSYSLSEGNLSLSGELSVYMSQVRNWIMWYYTVKGFSPENIELVDIKGFENNMNLSYFAGNTTVKINTGYSLNRSRDMGKRLNDSDLSYGKQLPYIPVNSANILAYIERKGWSVSHTWNFYSKRNTTTSNTEGSPEQYLYPYFMNQLSFGKKISSGSVKADVSFRIHNLFDEEYRSVLQRPMPGRNYSLLLKFSF